jgi:hypothetical protein
LHAKSGQFEGERVSPRVGFWLSGLVVGVAMAAAVPEALFPGARPAVFGAAFLVLGLIGEVLQSARVRHAAEEAAWRRDTRAADGRVELARVPGARGAPNPFDPRFTRFERLEPDGDPGASFAPPGWGGRDCPPLLGRVVIASLFLGRDGRTWSDAELAESHEAITRAAAWVEREAQRYRAAVNLELASAYFVADDDEADEVAIGFVAEGDDVGPFEERATTKALLRATRAAARLGFADAPALFRAVERRVAADVTVWLLHPRESGRSFAVPRHFRAPGGLSLAVCYPREASFPEPLNGPARADPVTVVHELLHLFGATDKYGRPLAAFAPRTVSTREVMRLSEDRLSRLRVDPGTAVEVGWVTDDLG